jgi:hypothetical protein
MVAGTGDRVGGRGRVRRALLMRRLLRNDHYLVIMSL